MQIATATALSQATLITLQDISIKARKMSEGRSIFDSGFQDLVIILGLGTVSVWQNFLKPILARCITTTIMSARLEISTRVSKLVGH